jgi:hypothetical protein
MEMPMEPAEDRVPNTLCNIHTAYMDNHGYTIYINITYTIYIIVINRYMIIYCIYIFTHCRGFVAGISSQQSGSFVQEPASPTSPAHLAVDCEFYKKKPGTGTGKIWKCIEVS